MTKQAILFDFWQTLFHDMKERESFEARKLLVKNFLAIKNSLNGLDVDAAFEASRPWFLGIYHDEQRTPIVSERLTWVLDYLGVSVAPPEFAALCEEFEEMGLMLDPRLSENLVPVLSELSRDYKLGIVSDTGYTPGRVLRKHMKKHGVLEFFSAFSFSDETGRAKPHARQFDNVLQQLGVAPVNAIHCGDLPSHDVLGAKQRGLTAVLYTGCHIAEESANGYQPDFVISDWLELPAIVRKVFA
ncbi:MAG: HAD family hydrolase [Candidatus Zixiibacteriota bacterium]